MKYGKKSQRPPGESERERIEAALASGKVLRFTGHAFEECGRRAGEGPKYSALALFRAVRMGRVRIDVRGEITRSSYLEIEARPAIKRTSDGLAASLDREAST